MVVAKVGATSSGLALESRLWGSDGDPIKIHATVLETG